MKKAPRSIRTLFIRGLMVNLFMLCLLPEVSALNAQEEEAQPLGAELYKEFLETLDSMDSFGFESDYLWKREGKTIGECTLRYYLERPGKYRVEVNDKKGDLAGLLICDDCYSWTLWPQGTTLFSQYHGTHVNETRIYKKDPAYRGMSISHQISLLPHVCMPVFNANAFFGGEESVMEYLDDIEYLGEETVEGEPCHILKVSMMEGQRIRTLWLSKTDSIPRKFFGELIIAKSQTTTEIWSSIEINPELDEGLFQWTPPEGYEERCIPSLEEVLLKVGDEAMPFRLKDSAGDFLDTTDYQGKIIWLMFWRIG